MTGEQEHFERTLRDGLGRLAGRAGPGPTAGEVASRLRRRTRRRWATGGLVAAAVAAIVAAALTLPQPAARRGLDAVPQIVTPAGPQPLPANAGLNEVEEGLRRYFASVGVRNGFYLAKSPDGAVSYAFSGGASVPPSRLRDDLKRILRHFRIVEAELRDSRLRCTLVAMTGNST